MTKRANASKPKVGDRLQVHIDRLAIGGRGVARHEGLVIFVDNAAPDEDAEIELTLVKKNFAEARLLRISKPSPFRVQPPCSVAGICGGCSWQHISYEQQLIQKRELVRETLRKFAGFDVSSPDAVLPVVPSPREFRYRNRVQLHYGHGRFGFNQRASHKIADIQDCLITEEALTERFAELKTQLQNKIGRTELYLTASGQVIIRDASLKPNNVRDGDQEDSGSELAFSQVNTAQNENLIKYVVGKLQESLPATGPRLIYDLYSGNGNFTFPIATAFPSCEIASAELNPRSVEAARARARAEFGQRSIRIDLSGVESFLADTKNEKPDAVVLDPPRTGCSKEVMQEISARSPQVIIYISCHPVTLARDLGLLNKETYELISVQPFDMFPQTDHVETVALLRARRT